MTERLSEVESRISSVRQLSAIVTAMRGIAAARSAEARHRLDGIASYSATIAEAISRVLAFSPAPAREDGEAGSDELVIAIFAEQGFVGGYDNRILDAFQGLLAERMARPSVALVGTRGASEAEAHGVAGAWTSPMAGHADEIGTVANRLADRVFSGFATGSIRRLSLVHAVAEDGSQGPQVVERELIPFDFSRFPSATLASPPMTQLPTGELLASLAEEYLFAELCEALTLAFASESTARMHTMVAAHENVEQRLEELVAHRRLLRKGQITEEVIELVTATRVETSFGN